VETIARLKWRKQNLLTYRIAQQAISRYSKIRSELVPETESSLILHSFDQPDPNEVRTAEEAAEEQARKELGQAWNLVEINEVVTTDYLLNELSLMDRLDGMIDRCLKRLLFVRGIKSLGAPAITTPSRKKLTTA